MTKGLSQTIDFQGSGCTHLYFSSRLAILVMVWESCLSLSTYVCLVTIVLTSDQRWYLRVECPAVASPPILGTSKPGQDAATWHLQTELSNYQTVHNSSGFLRTLMCKQLIHCSSWLGLHCALWSTFWLGCLCCTTLCPWWACLLNLPFAPICSSIFF